MTITAISGSGSVVSNPAGISCSSGLGSGCDTFGFSSNLQLTATPDWKSVFGSWGGACASSANPCSLTALASDRSVSLSFAPNYQAILAGAPGIGYNTLQSAYNATVNGSTILAHVHDFYEDLIFNQSRSINSWMAEKPQ